MAANNNTANLAPQLIKPKSSISSSQPRLSSSIAFIQFDHLRFLVMDAPSDNNISLYIKDFEKYNCKHIVRVCQSTYNKQPLEQIGITVHDWPFDDGEAPPSSIIDDWLSLVATVFSHAPTSGKDKNAGAITPAMISKDDRGSTDALKPEDHCIAVHCVAGLGRAPVLVAIALIENGMSPLDSVAFVRERRRGAINNKQLKFLEGYKPRRKEKCVIQ